MKILAIAILGGLLILPVFGQEFNYIKLGPLLKERQKIIDGANNRVAPSRFSNKTLLQLQENDNKISQRLYGESSNRSKGIFSDPELSPIFNKIQNYLTNKYEAIGEQQTDTILHYNNSFDLGSINYPGFTWQKPMGVFTIGVNRQLLPNLFDLDQWIVVDTFVIGIDATTYLNKLNDGEVLNMSEDQIRAFAGLSFQRTYRYEHYASSYIEALTSDFSKLFLSFLKFRKSKILSLDPNEYITKEDYLKVAAGAAASINYYCISATAGAYVSFDRVAKVGVKSIGPEYQESEGEFLRLSVEKSNSTSAGVTLALQLDFMKILQLQLFTFDFEYELTKSQKAYLSFKESDRDLLAGDTPQGDEFNKLLKLKIFEVSALVDNVVSLEEKTEEKSTSNYSVLNFKGATENSFESHRFIDDGSVSTFFRQNYSKEKVEQNFFGKIFGDLLSSLASFGYSPKLERSTSQKLAFEYEEGAEQKDEQFSLSFSQEYAARKTTRKRNKNKYKKSKRESIAFVKQYTSLGSDVIDSIKNDQLRGPLQVQSTVQIYKEGIDYFNSLSTDSAFYIFAKDVCQSNRANKWKKNKWRKKYLRRLQIKKSEICTKRLGKKYLAYKEKIQNSSMIPIDAFRKFMVYLRKKSWNKDNFYKLFNSSNVSLNGSFRAKTSDDQYFQTYFNDGDFKGYGAIDKFMRNSGGMIIPGS